jgi:hypothetical protein
MAMALLAGLRGRKGGEKGRREWAAAGRKEEEGEGENEPKWLFYFLIYFSFS